MLRRVLGQVDEPFTVRGVRKGHLKIARLDAATVRTCRASVTGRGKVARAYRVGCTDSYEDQAS